MDIGLIIIWCFGIAAVLATVAVYIAKKRLKRRDILGAVYTVGDAVSHDEYYRLYFSAQTAQQEIVFKVVTILSEETGVNFWRVSPDERLDGAIAGLLDGMDLVEVLYRLEEEVKTRISDEEASNATTVRSIVELVNVKIQNV